MKTQSTHTKGIAASILLTAAAILAVTGGSGAISIMGPLDPPTQEAIACGDWAQVAELLGAVDENTPSPVARCVKAHACLALNRNNESLLLFVSSDSDEALNQWDEWTQGFVAANPGNATAHYLRGDALARYERWDEAIVELTAALTCNPKHWLALNARGVAYARLEEWTKAIVDFTSAARANPSFADAYASFGFMWIQKSDGAQGAARLFDKALEINPEFALALYGRACIEFVSGELEKSRTDYAAAADKAGCSKPYMALMLAELQTDIEDALCRRDKTAADDADNPQMALQRRLDKISAGDTGFLDVNLHSALSAAVDHPEWRGLINDTIGKAVIDHPEMGSKIAGVQRTHEFLAGVGDVVADVAKTLDIKSHVDVWGAGAGKGWAGVGKGTLDIDMTGTGFADHLRAQSQMTRDALSSFGGIPGVGGTPAPSGFKTSPDEAAWDGGDWPFAAQYGLVYPNHSGATS